VEDIFVDRYKENRRITFVLIQLPLCKYNYLCANTITFVQIQLPLCKYN